jgi:hypothetical protein
METMTIVFLVKNYEGIGSFVAKYVEMTELLFFLIFESAMINEYEAVSSGCTDSLSFAL